MTEIPCLTIRQPWAERLFALPAAKDIENRSWATRYRGPLAIHAGRQVDELGVEVLGEPSSAALRDAGSIIGTVTLVDCHDAGSVECSAARWACEGNPWAFWPAERGQRVVHWRVEHPRRFVTPITARGQVGLWSPPPSVAHLIEIAEVLT